MHPVADLEVFEGGFQFIKIFALFNVETKKKGLSNLEITFVAFLSLNIALSAQQPPESLHLNCYKESISRPSTH